MTMAIVISFTLQRLLFQIFVLFVGVGHNFFELQKHEDQAERCHKNAGENLPLEGKIHRGKFLAGGSEDLDAIVQHQRKEAQLPHGSEAYTPTADSPYEASDPYRTTDCTKNIVKVGAEMATVFRAHGFKVLHDTNLYDYPSYNGAYERSKAAVEQWLAEYPSISVVLDVHRDALSAEDGTPYRLITTEVGRQTAQVMTVVGTNGGGSSHTRWTENLSFALFLQQKLEKGFDALARPIVLRSAGFNQQLCVPGYLLVEVGGHGNTLADAIEGARFWADTAARALKNT